MARRARGPGRERVRVPSAPGAVSERPYYTDAELESIAIHELGRVGLLPTSPEAIRIERFVEKRFNLASVRYESLPPGVLGYTHFGPSGVESIIVARQLSEERSRVAERRINTTLAHEAGHGLLHARLFALDRFPDLLFQDGLDVTPTRILCRDDLDPGEQRRAYDGRWWEYQANRMIGALLIPRTLVHAALESLQVPTGHLGLPTLPTERRRDAAQRLSDIFDVNLAVAAIRVQRLFGSAEASQLTL